MDIIAVYCGRHSVYLAVKLYIGHDNKTAYTKLLHTKCTGLRRTNNDK